MTTEEIVSYLTSTLSFMQREEPDNPVKHWTNYLFSVDVFPAYTLYYHAFRDRLHLSLSWDENNDSALHDFKGIALKGEGLTQRAIFDFLRRTGYPPAVRLHRLAVLGALAMP